MTKAKWLEFSSENTLAGFSQALGSQQFRRESNSGFELTEVKKESVRGRFVEEIITNEIFIDPFGEEIINKVRRYYIFDFFVISLKHKRFLLRLNDPPRSLKPFISALSEALGFGFVIEALKIDVLSLLNHFKRYDIASGWKIKKVRMSDLRLTTTSFARIEVSSQGDAYLDLQEKMNIENALLERATVECIQAGIPCLLELFSKGVVMADDDFLEKLSPALKSYFSS